MNGYDSLGEAGLADNPLRSQPREDSPSAHPLQHGQCSPVTVPAELAVVVAPKLKAEVAVLLLLAPGPKTNGVTAAPALDVVAGLLSCENSNGWEAPDSVEVPKAELLTGMVACPNTKAVTGALAAGAELPKTAPAAAGALAVGALLFRKLNTGLAAAASADGKGGTHTS